MTGGTEASGSGGPVTEAEFLGREAGSAPLVMPADEFAAVKAVMAALTGPDGKPVPYLTGVGRGWHAVSLPSMEYLRTGPADSVAFAECGELVRVAPEVGAYNRADVPVSHDPCQACAWTVAAQTGTLEREAGLLVPTGNDLAALTRVLPDPVLAAKIARAILAAPDWEPGHPADVQLLATVAAHAPVLLLPEGCAEGDCEHGDECDYPEASAGCKACSLQAGSWAGEWEGQFREECQIPAPCRVLLALAEHAGVTAKQVTVSRDDLLAAINTRGAVPLEVISRLLTAAAEAGP